MGSSPTLSILNLFFPKEETVCCQVSRGDIQWGADVASARRWAGGRRVISQGVTASTMPPLLSAPLVRASPQHSEQDILWLPCSWSQSPLG